MEEIFTTWPLKFEIKSGGPVVVCEHLKVSLTVNKEIRIAVINIFVSSRDSQVKSCYNFHDFFSRKEITQILKKGKS